MRIIKVNVVAHCQTKKKYHGIDEKGMQLMFIGIIRVHKYKKIDYRQKGNEIYTDNLKKQPHVLKFTAQYGVFQE